MISQGHKKHADIKRPSIGEFGRFELGLIGAPCNIILKLVEEVTEYLSPLCTITYVDADHQSAKAKAYTNLTDRISHHRIEYHHSLNEYDRKIVLSTSDLIFVNGNHFKSRKQIVFCTRQKKDSLERKLEKLTDVGLIILDHDIQMPHSFLKKEIPGIGKIPILKIDEIDKISDWIIENYKSQIAPVKGLVLAGGLSQRMGKDKALLRYHDIPQVNYACQQLKDAGVEPVISCRAEQSDLFDDQYPLLHDSFTGLGPFGAILTAFRSDPDTAWLVIACDQPLLASQYLQSLIANRQTSKIATCYHNPETGFPEPLITLWEPRAYQRLLSFLSMGYSCPRKVLINSDINELKVTGSDFMINANTPEEQERIMQLLNQ